MEALSIYFAMVIGANSAPRHQYQFIILLETTGGVLARLSASARVLDMRAGASEKALKIPSQTARRIWTVLLFRRGTLKLIPQSP